MLVLSRAAGEKLVFPSIGATVQVLRIKGKAVRLGIDAPSEVPVIRHELLEDAQQICAEYAQRNGSPQDKKLRHAMRNRLNAASLALHLYHKQLEQGLADAAEATFAKVIEEFEAIEQEMARSRDAAPPACEPRQRRTLVVEDDSNECELLAGFLRMSGFEVATAGDGADAIDYLLSHDTPDVVLLDMFMPRCDGPATVNAIRDNPSLNEMKVFAISGTSPASLGVATGPRGVNRWFPKPVNPEQLVRELDRELVFC